MNSAIIEKIEAASETQIIGLVDKNGLTTLGKAVMEKFNSKRGTLPETVSMFYAAESECVKEVATVLAALDFPEVLEFRGYRKAFGQCENTSDHLQYILDISKWMIDMIPTDGYHDNRHYGAIQRLIKETYPHFELGHGSRINRMIKEFELFMDKREHLIALGNEFKYTSFTNPQTENVRIAILKGMVQELVHTKEGYDIYETKPWIPQGKAAQLEMDGRDISENTQIPSFAICAVKRFKNLDQMENIYDNRHAIWWIEIPEAQLRDHFPTLF